MNCLIRAGSSLQIRVGLLNRLHGTPKKCAQRNVPCTTKNQFIAESRTHCVHALIFTALLIFQLWARPEDIRKPFEARRLRKFWTTKRSARRELNSKPMNKYVLCIISAIFALAFI